MSDYLYDEGVYFGTIKHSFLGETANETPFIQFNVYVTEEEQEDGVVKALEKPFTAPVVLYLSVNAIERTAQTLKYLGFTGTLEQLATHSFKDQKVTVRCDISEWQGKESNKWQFVRRAKEATPEAKSRIFSKLSDRFTESMNKALGKVPEIVPSLDGDGEVGFMETGEWFPRS